MKRRSIRIENSPAPRRTSQCACSKARDHCWNAEQTDAEHKDTASPAARSEQGHGSANNRACYQRCRALYGREPPGRLAKKKMPPHPPRRVLPASGKLEIRRFGGLLVSRGCNNPHLCLVVSHPKRDHILWQRGIGNKLSCAERVGNWGKPGGLSQVVNRECTGG